jgi:hypothetical protein
MTLHALIESRLHNGPDWLVLNVTGTAEEVFLDVVIRAHRDTDPTLTDAELRLRPGAEDAIYRLD